MAGYFLEQISLAGSNRRDPTHLAVFVTRRYDIYAVCRIDRAEVDSTEREVGGVV